MFLPRNEREARRLRDSLLDQVSILMSNAGHVANFGPADNSASGMFMRALSFGDALMGIEEQLMRQGGEMGLRVATYLSALALSPGAPSLNGPLWQARDWLWAAANYVPRNHALRRALLTDDNTWVAYLRFPPVARDGRMVPPYRARTRAPW